MLSFCTGHGVGLHDGAEDAIGVCEDPKALGGLTGLNLESGGWASLVKAELQPIMLEAAASP